VEVHTEQDDGAEARRWVSQRQNRNGRLKIYTAYNTREEKKSREQKQIGDRKRDGKT